MEFVRGLSVAEGRLLNSLSTCAYKHGHYVFVPWNDGSEVGGRISQDTRYKLAELGVVYPEDLHLRMFRSAMPLYIERGNEVIHIEPSAPHREIQFPIAKLTALGVELLELVGTAPNIELTNAIGKFFVGQGCPVSYGQIVDRTATGIQFQKQRYHAPGAEEITINPGI